MTYPQQPPAQQPGYYPSQQPQPYAPQQQAYYPPPPQQQAYYPPPPQQQQQQQQQQYGAPEPLPSGTIDEFYGQAVGSGKALSFEGKPVGFTYTAIIPRTITNADIQAQTDIRNRSVALRHPDGRVKLVMVVPLQMQPSAEFPDGRAAWYVKGADRTELEAAMERAGCKPGTPPEMGAVITITYMGERPIPGLNPQKMKQVTYQRPQGAPQQAAPEYREASPAPAPVSVPQANGNGHQQAPQGAPAPQQAPQGQYMAPPQFQAPQQQAQFQAPPAPAPAMAPVPPQDFQQAPPGSSPAPGAQPGPAPVPDLSPEQHALLARLTGQ